MSRRRDRLLLLASFLTSFTAYAAHLYGRQVAGLLLGAYFVGGMFVVGYSIGPWMTSATRHFAPLGE